MQHSPEGTEEVRAILLRLRSSMAYARIGKDGSGRDLCAANVALQYFSRVTVNRAPLSLLVGGREGGHQAVDEREGEHHLGEAENGRLASLD